MYTTIRPGKMEPEIRVRIVNLVEEIDHMGRQISLYEYNRHPWIGRDKSFQDKTSSTVRCSQWYEVRTVWDKPVSAKNCNRGPLLLTSPEFYHVSLLGRMLASSALGRDTFDAKSGPRLRCLRLIARVFSLLCHSSSSCPSSCPRTDERSRPANKKTRTQASRCDGSPRSRAIVPLCS